MLDFYKEKIWEKKRKKQQKQKQKQKQNRKTKTKTKKKTEKFTKKLGLFAKSNDRYGSSSQTSTTRRMLG